MKNYEITITLVANRKPTLDELHDFLFCRIRDGDLKYKITILKQEDLCKKNTTGTKRL